MKDYYLNVTGTKKAAFLNELPLRIKAGFSDGIYQDEDVVIDWIGKVPNTYNPDGTVATYKVGFFFNIRVLNPEFEQKVERFVNTTPVNWTAEPFRVFGSDPVEPIV